MKNNLQETERELVDALHELTKYQRKLVSPLWNFLQGIINGFGVFIGSALLVSLLVYILSKFDTVPIIGNYIARIVHIVQHK